LPKLQAKTLIQIKFIYFFDEKREIILNLITGIY